MRKFVNSPKEFVPEMLRGLALANPTTLRYIPEYNLIVVVTGWDILPPSEEPRHDELERVIVAVKNATP